MEAHVEIVERDFAFQNRLQTFSLINHDHVDIKEFFGDAFQYFEIRITQIVGIHFLVKVGACFCAIFEKPVTTEDGERREYQTI